MLQPALLGGVAIGVLSALPIVNLANCCCAWILFGGGLAAYQLQQKQQAPLAVGDGAVVGLMAGAIGAVIWVVLSIPLEAFQASLLERALAGAQDMPPEARDFLERFRGGAARGAAAAVVFVITLFVSSTFGMLGGLFGALLFRKNAPPPPPPSGGYDPRTPPLPDIVVDRPGGMPPPIPPADGAGS
ncbi:MAG: hypothetical protein R2712_20050 [Vicinamibacterales bacterium]